MKILENRIARKGRVDRALGPLLALLHPPAAGQGPLRGEARPPRGLRQPCKTVGSHELGEREARRCGGHRQEPGRPDAAPVSSRQVVLPFQKKFLSQLDT